MNTANDYFRVTQRFGGAFEEDWHQHRVHFEHLGMHYDLTEKEMLDFIRLYLRAGDQSFL